MNRKETLALPDGFTYRSELRRHVTPWFLKKQPVHRWFFFPHSFSPELVDEILAAFPLPTGGRILDPFAGAGTTVLRAKERGYSAAGVDLSPLSVFVARAKTAGYDRTLLKEAFDHVR
ncbi:DNA methyltransferase, partial [Hydrogenibacillus schlegelii]|uniref:DNA methyltransferase n=1 Tax=Hydrogenibacillus schlegelii TaxID=1484 RepID=UPI00235602B2